MMQSAARLNILFRHSDMKSDTFSRNADTPDPSEVQWQHGMQELTAPLKDWEADFQARHSENLHHHGTEGTRIGVCFDGSPQSDRAFEIACRFLRPQSHIKDSLHGTNRAIILFRYQICRVFDFICTCRSCFPMERVPPHHLLSCLSRSQSFTSSISPLENLPLDPLLCRKRSGWCTTARHWHESTERMGTFVSFVPR